MRAQKQNDHHEQKCRSFLPAGRQIPDDLRAQDAKEEAAYHALFGVLTVVLITAVAIYSRSQDVRPSDEMRARAKPQGG